jgi:hypothetical protein
MLNVSVSLPEHLKDLIEANDIDKQFEYLARYAPK